MLLFGWSKFWTNQMHDPGQYRISALVPLDIISRAGKPLSASRSVGFLLCYTFKIIATKKPTLRPQEKQNWHDPFDGNKHRTPDCKTMEQGTYFNFQQLVIGGMTGGCWSWDIPSKIQFSAQSWRNMFFLSDKDITLTMMMFFYASVFLPVLCPASRHYLT